MLILLNKPFEVLSQFTTDDERLTLKSFISTPDVYPAGRLDYDSEGALLLTDDGKLQARITDPQREIPKTYWVQVEGKVDSAALHSLARGVRLNDGWTPPAEVMALTDPPIWPRHPPIRHRETIATAWLAITIREGRNRQVRRMTAAVGLPCLRLIRVQIGKRSVLDLNPGESTPITWNELWD
jgi:23S rRNA pseudouridine2457 synthase